jgi:hypothetical protein
MGRAVDVHGLVRRPRFRTMHPIHRVFCATAFELESERRIFEELLSAFNETDAMPRGVLFAPLFLLRMRDKRPYQAEIDDNIRECRYYLLALTGDWGPPERNFKADYRLALRCKDDPALPMSDTVLLLRRYEDDPPPAPGLPTPAAEFETPEQFAGLARGVFARWLEEIAPK